MHTQWSSAQVIDLAAYDLWLTHKCLDFFLLTVLWSIGLVTENASAMHFIDLSIEGHRNVITSGNPTHFLTLTFRTVILKLSRF